MNKKIVVMVITGIMIFSGFMILFSNSGYDNNLGKNNINPFIITNGYYTTKQTFTLNSTYGINETILPSSDLPIYMNSINNETAHYDNSSSNAITSNMVYYNLTYNSNYNYYMDFNMSGSPFGNTNGLDNIFNLTLNGKSYLSVSYSLSGGITQIYINGTTYSLASSDSYSNIFVNLTSNKLEIFIPVEESSGINYNYIASYSISSTDFSIVNYGNHFDTSATTQINYFVSFFKFSNVPLKINENGITFGQSLVYENIDFKNYTLPAFPNMIYTSEGDKTNNFAISSFGNSPLHKDGVFYINASWDLVFYNLQTLTITLLHKFNDNIKFGINLAGSPTFVQLNAGLMDYQLNNNSIKYIYIAGENMTSGDYSYAVYNLYNNTYISRSVGFSSTNYQTFNIFDSQGYWYYNPNSATTTYIGNIYVSSYITSNSLDGTVGTNNLGGNSIAYIGDNILFNYGIEDTNHTLRFNIAYFNPSTDGSYVINKYFPFADITLASDYDNPVEMHILNNGTLEVFAYIVVNSNTSLSLTLGFNGNITNTKMYYINYTNVRIMENSNQPQYTKGIVVGQYANSNNNFELYNYNNNTLIYALNHWLNNYLLTTGIELYSSSSGFLNDGYNGYRFLYGNEPLSYYKNETTNNNTNVMVMWLPAYTSEFSTNLPNHYTLQIQENGLPSGTSWSYTFNGTSYTLVNATYDYSLVNGTYALTVNSISGYGVTYPSSITINGANKIAYVNFTANTSVGNKQVAHTYEIYFNVVGLPKGTQWSLIVGNNQYFSNTSTLILYLSNGTYTPIVSSSQTYTLSEATPYLVVTGQSENYTIFANTNNLAFLTNNMPYLIVLLLFIGMFIVALAIKRSAL